MECLKLLFVWRQGTLFLLLLLIIYCTEWYVFNIPHERDESFLFTLWTDILLSVYMKMSFDRNERNCDWFSRTNRRRNLFHSPEAEGDFDRDFDNDHHEEKVANKFGFVPRQPRWLSIPPLAMGRHSTSSFHHQQGRRLLSKLKSKLQVSFSKIFMLWPWIRNPRLLFSKRQKQNKLAGNTEHCQVQGCI